MAARQKLGYFARDLRYRFEARGLRVEQANQLRSREAPHQPEWDQQRFALYLGQTERGDALPEHANDAQAKISDARNGANRILLRKHQIGETLGQERDLRSGYELVRIEVPAPADNEVTDSLISVGYADQRHAPLATRDHGHWRRPSAGDFDDGRNRSHRLHVRERQLIAELDRLVTRLHTLGIDEIRPNALDLFEHILPAAQTGRHYEHHRRAADEDAHRAEQRPHLVRGECVDGDLPRLTRKCVQECLEHVEWCGSYSRYNISRIPSTIITTGQILLNTLRQFVSM